VLGLVVLSRWVLDWVAHAPDLSVLFNRSRRVGLGLQYSPEGTIHWRRALAAGAGLLGARFAINRTADRMPTVPWHGIGALRSHAELTDLRASSGADGTSPSRPESAFGLPFTTLTA
jgi:hypothetical protein